MNTKTDKSSYTGTLNIKLCGCKHGPHSMFTFSHWQHWLQQLIAEVTDYGHSSLSGTWISASTSIIYSRKLESWPKPPRQLCIRDQWRIPQPHHLCVSGVLPCYTGEIRMRGCPCSTLVSRNSNQVNETQRQEQNKYSYLPIPRDTSSSWQECLRLFCQAISKCIFKWKEEEKHTAKGNTCSHSLQRC